ncbi:polynucleotide adenylyltransferase PcnB [Neiella marina]|uniref:Poly(A) polymerase I n=1 Tax=Neiella holothuriorum TaxID=2870530 RepID=A0ABS7EB03_9GAMM|nr:polynucleotide adenylyltransferase PcnB [Neiella holothuriorum]MBW8189513.1 polynucleotide adenylyltransferase PcnB [Neiella holothuriorum]
MPRAEHNISRKDISPNAIKVMYRLNKSGFQAYLVGGGVRDLLLGLSPKDFDIVTDAKPEEVKKLFHNCRLIGRRFRLAHIMFGREIIEVATMRGHHDEEKGGHISKRDSSGMIVRDNVYGSIEEDAERRDFSINALYYNIADYSILDFANGANAIANRRIEMIGDPVARYREDPVRMLRAVRFATKLDMTIEPATADPIHEIADALGGIPAARLFDEMCKLLLAGKAEQNFKMLREFGLFDALFPELGEYLANDASEQDLAFIQAALNNTDQRVNSDQSVTPAFIYAALLWPLVESKARELEAESELSQQDAFQIAASETLDRQQQRTAVPKRFSLMSRDIWTLQLRMPKRQGKRAERLATHPKIRAGFDFLLLRGQVYGGELQQLASWWQQFLESSGIQRGALIRETSSDTPKRSSRRRRPRRKPQPKAAPPSSES